MNNPDPLRGRQLSKTCEQYKEAMLRQTGEYIDSFSAPTIPGVWELVSQEMWGRINGDVYEFTKKDPYRKAGK